MTERISRDELRQLIREALREALGAVSPPSTRGEGDHAPHNGGGGHERGGRHSPPPPRSAVPLPGAAGEERAHRLDSGLLTEAKLVEIGRTHRKVHIAAEVVVTPLARDRARILKVEIVRQKP